jgi:tetratricopeptide (TPR) repeat protein
MVQMAFFLRFKRQLQHTRPELIPRLEDIATRAVEEAGGRITRDRSLIRAAFNENSLGFWLDMLLFIETLTQTLEEVALDLHGYSLLLGTALPEPVSPLCRFLAGEKGGVFLDKTAAEAMRPYLTVEEEGRWTAATHKYSAGPLVRLNSIKIFVPTARTDFSLKKTSIELADLRQRPAVLVASQSFEGKRDKLYQRVADFANSGDNGDFSPLFVRFDSVRSGSGGLNTLIDSWAEWVHPLSTEEEEIAALREFLFRQRLRDKSSPFAIRRARRFYKLLLTLYRRVAHAAGKIPLIILENLQNAEQPITDIVIESLHGWHNFLLLGTCTGEINDEHLAKWKPLFPQLTRISAGEEAHEESPDLPLDLWEIGYACLLLGRYFPPGLLPQLLEEAGKSPLMISRALSMLYAHRVLDTPLDPRPWSRHFQYQAEAALGERKDRIRTLVRSRLLAWVAQKKIDPCLHLLEVLKELNGAEEISDSLILQSIHGELIGADEAALEHIRQNGIPAVITGPARAPLLHSILETLLALHSGNLNEIHAAFTNDLPDCSAFPPLNAQALLNRSLYFMGLRDINSAGEAVKEASLLCQKNGSGKVGSAHGGALAQTYRLFALASLLRGRVGETIDYLGFALENAAKSGGFQDIGMAAYYAASVQLLYGNLSRSKTLAEKARRHFLKAGNPEWADRSRFLLGRLAFEIGSYQQAIDIFEKISQNPEGVRSPEKSALLEVWACRAKAYCRPSRSYRPQCGGLDAQLFEIEDLCLAGDYAGAVKLFDTPPSPLADSFLYIEQPDWRSGFAQCELLHFSWDDLRDRMLGTYYSLAQSCLSSAKAEEAMNTMQRILRGGQFPEIDPYDVFCHYAWYRVLKQSGSSQVNISTAVSVAFKRLQSRAGRIDDMEIRRQYLTQPRSNRALDQAAREFKLI